MEMRVQSDTRAQAIEDGVVVDASEIAKEAGIKFPWREVMAQDSSACMSRQ